MEITTLLSAYCQGIFPMADELGEISWFCPDPRTIIPIDTYKPSKSLRPIINRNTFEIRINEQFEQVMRFCALPRKDDGGVWISEELIQAFTQLHKIGFAHSVEAYQNNELVGGLYGVCIGGVFFGESMFSKVSNSSKVAFHYLIQILRKNGFVLLDSQFMNDNVKRYGAIEIPKKEFDELLHVGINKKCEFTL
ncbi:MAG: leucyl/phenylalanyl-tRNA--protein transferase [Flavobacteriales bacterium]|nr:leucyl/phenylalanyl-tRNA--protein transferase [Flavobacteriales bacterium]